MSVKPIIKSVIVQNSSFELDETIVIFLRVSVENLKAVVAEIIQIVVDESWMKKITPGIMQRSFIARARPTINKLAQKLENAIYVNTGNIAVQNIGETIVSVVAHSIIERQLQYKALPLAEIIKHNESQNSGFDFYNEKDNMMIVFGEAKYRAGKNAYNDALEQVVDFIAKDNHIKDMADISQYVSENVFNNINSNNVSDRDKFCYAAAFSTVNRRFNEQKLINNIKNNAHFRELVSQNHKELVLVAVDING